MDLSVVIHPVVQGQELNIAVPLQIRTGGDHLRALLPLLRFFDSFASGKPQALLAPALSSPDSGAEWWQVCGTLLSLGHMKLTVLGNDGREEKSAYLTIAGSILPDSLMPIMGWQGKL